MDTCIPRGEVRRQYFSKEKKMDENTTYILSLDWDYVTGNCQPAVGGTCCGYCGKGSTQYRNNLSKRGKNKGVSADWEKRFNRLKNIQIEPDTDIYVAECHADIMQVIDNFYSPYEVMDFDYHYDRYVDGKLCCGNWIYHLERLGGHVVKKPFDIKCVDAVFFCRSAPWTPKSMDERFHELVYRYCIKSGVEPEFIGHMRKSLRKTYRRLFGN